MSKKDHTEIENSTSSDTPDNLSDGLSDSLSDNLKEKIKKQRQRHNAELIQKMRDGESLTSFDAMSSWFPPRPTIEKDKRAIEKLYSLGAKKTSQDKSTSAQKDASADNLKPTLRKMGELKSEGTDESVSGIEMQSNPGQGKRSSKEVPSQNAQNKKSKKSKVRRLDNLIEIFKEDVHN